MYGNDCVARVVNIVKDDDIYLLCRRYSQQHNYFSYPMDSSDLHIYKVKRLSSKIFKVPLESILCKCVMLPLKKYFIAIPLIHSLIIPGVFKNPSCLVINIKILFTVSFWFPIGQIYNRGANLVIFSYLLYIIWFLLLNGINFHSSIV